MPVGTPRTAVVGPDEVLRTHSSLDQENRVVENLGCAYATRSTVVTEEIRDGAKEIQVFKMRSTFLDGCALGAACQHYP